LFASEKQHYNTHPLPNNIPVNAFYQFSAPFWALLRVSLPAALGPDLAMLALVMLAAVLVMKSVLLLWLLWVLVPVMAMLHG
jgi:hypothetical protein